MSFLKQIFSGKDEPSERQIKRALRQVTQTHGEAATRVSAMERIAGWKTAEAAATLLRRFTIQVPQASMDSEEKQYAVRLLVEMGKPAVEPILQHLRTESEVTYPVRALREILPLEEYTGALLATLKKLSAEYTRWPEAKKVMIDNLSDDAFPQALETVLRLLEDEDDDVCIAASDYLARNGDEDVREKLIQTYLSSESRPRVRGRILGHFCDKEWPVKGYRKKIEETLQDPFYLTSKGTVKRRAV